MQAVSDREGQRKRFRPVWDTLIGGAVFLVPVGIVVFVLGRAFGVALKLVKPVIDVLPIESVGGIALVNVAAILLVVLICMIAGKIARSRIGKVFAERIEEKIHIIFPRYSFVKSMAESMTGVEKSNDLVPCIVSLDDASQVAFEVERLEAGGVVVYLPGSPDPWSGAVLVVTAERVKPLDVEFTEAVRSLKQAGRGTAALMEGRTDVFFDA